MTRIDTDEMGETSCEIDGIMDRFSMVKLLILNPKFE